MSSRQIYDAVTNDSDKTVLVPADKRYRLMYGFIELITTITVGNRQVALEIIDASANVIFRSLAGAVQAANTTREYHFSPNVVREAAFISNQILIPIPPELILLPGWSYRIYDTAAIAAAADDMTTSFLIEDRDLNKFDPQAG